MAVIKKSLAKKHRTLGKGSKTSGLDALIKPSKAKKSKKHSAKPGLTKLSKKLSGKKPRGTRRKSSAKKTAKK